MKLFKLFRAAILAAPLLASLALAAQKPLEIPPDYLVAKAAWRLAAIADYEFSLRRDCACLPEQPITVVVRDGKVQRAYFSISKIDVDAKRMSSLDTLSGLFRVIDEAYAGAAAEVKFKANAQLGYLEYLSIDFNARIADEELIYYIFDFRPAEAVKRQSNNRSAKAVIAARLAIEEQRELA